MFNNTGVNHPLWIHSFLNQRQSGSARRNTPLSCTCPLCKGDELCVVTCLNLCLRDPLEKQLLSLNVEHQCSEALLTIHQTRTFYHVCGSAEWGGELLLPFSSFWSLTPYTQPLLPHQPFRYFLWYFIRWQHHHNSQDDVNEQPEITSLSDGPCGKLTSLKEILRCRMKMAQDNPLGVVAVAPEPDPLPLAVVLSTVKPHLNLLNTDITCSALPFPAGYTIAAGACQQVTTCQPSSCTVGYFGNPAISQCPRQGGNFVFTGCTGLCLIKIFQTNCDTASFFDLECPAGYFAGTVGMTACSGTSLLFEYNLSLTNKSFPIPLPACPVNYFASTVGSATCIRKPS